MTAIFKGPWQGGRIAKFGFQHILKHKSGLAKSAQEITPAVKEFHGTLFPVRSSLLRRWERAIQIIRITNDEAGRHRHETNLRAGGLFVTA